jgi:hypothetical protein
MGEDELGFTFDEVKRCWGEDWLKLFWNIIDVGLPRFIP